MNLIEAIEQLKQIAFADDKTPLGNALALEQEVKQIENGSSKFDVIVFGDLNEFKTLNDEHGHYVGDIAITQVGEKIQQNIVKKLKAKAFRPHGDEFVILLKQNMLKAFLKEVSSFASIPFSYEEKSLATKMSFGYTINDGKSPFIDLLQRAETACQTAKYEGDGVCLEWTNQSSKNTFISGRKKCRKCAAKFEWKIPKRNASAGLEICPFCNEPF